MIMTLFIAGLLLILLGIFIIIKDKLIIGFSKFSLTTTVMAEQGGGNWLEGLAKVLEAFSKMLDRFPYPIALAVILIVVGACICCAAILLSPAGSPLLEKLIQLNGSAKK